MRKYPGLDLLKVYLMFSIAFCFHYKNLLLDATLPYPFYSILHYGYDYGGWFVILFFSISGFLAQSQRQRIEKESMRGFLGRKILHLYPMMWLSVFVGAAGQWMTLLTGGWFPMCRPCCLPGRFAEIWRNTLHFYGSR